MNSDLLIRNLLKTRRRFFRPTLMNTYSHRPAPVATPGQVRETQLRLGFGLPPLLGRIYTEVGNGGFGPGYGLIGAVGGATDDRGDTIVTAYENRFGTDPHDLTWQWPAQLVPLFSWGGASYTCGDFRVPECPLIEFDPARMSPRQSMTHAFIPHNRTLHEYLAAWISGADVMLA